jgi:K+-transporting ATPase ATPase A chain
LYIIILIPLSYLLGNYFAKVFQGEKHILSSALGEAEKLIYKILGIDKDSQMNWKEYAIHLLIFNLLGILFLTALQLTQQMLPLNPQHLPKVDFLLALNTAISFVTNTNWQSYAGETTLSYLVQMAGLTVQNFLSAATGIAVLIALVRGIAVKNGKTIGNFWVDITRSVLYILLPLSIILSVLLISQGVVQNFNHYATASTLDGFKQIIPMGPAASQIAIKQLGTNGGGFFNANSAFPFENPTPFSNFLEMLSILLIPVSLVFTYGKMLGSKKHAWTIFGVMLFIFIALLAISYFFETSYNPIFNTNRIMEGKELRFGIFNSVLWSSATTAASNGSVNSMISSLSPMSGLTAMLNIQLGEIIFGGVGAGLYGMFLFIIITVFISGLMVGRTPEYFGKKIEAYEIKWSIIAVLLPSIAILLFSSIAAETNQGLLSILNKGPHGLSEILYAFTSAAGNNGSAFAGLNTNTNFYNILMSIAFLIGRYGVIVPILAVSGSLVKKNISPATSGTLATDNLMFAFLLTAVILIVGALTFFPVLSIGPLLEHFLMHSGVTF